jgi:DNA-binding transcriptional ArsR family regulator
VRCIPPPSRADLSARAETSSAYREVVRTIALAEMAAVLAEPARATMCLALIDGRAWTVGELARAASVAPSTGTAHVARLIDAGFVESVRQGRHHYVRIADHRVAELIEALAEHAEHRPRPGLRASLRAERLATARTCYDHLAGRLGVQLRAGMIRLGLLDDTSGLAVTVAGQQVLDDLGIPRPRKTSRPLLRDCLDWTERREHLGGALAAAILDRALAAHWLTRTETRAIRLRPSATEPFAALGVDLDEVTAPASAPRTA